MDQKTKSLCAKVRQLVSEFRKENHHFYSKEDYYRARRIYVRFKMEGSNPNEFKKYSN
jgi:hypothetical protein